MLRRPDDKEHDGDAAMTERFRHCERIIAESQSRKRDTSLLGAQLQEMLVRNEKLTDTMEKRDSKLMEFANANE